MDYERFKEGFQDALKAELAVRGADVELTARRVDKMNESYDAITVRPTGSSLSVLTTKNEITSVCQKQKKISVD